MDSTVSPAPRPAQPAYIRLVNALGNSLGSSSLGNVLARVGLSGPALDADRLLAHARRRTGLSDFGEPAFRAGLEQLLCALRAQGALTPIGRLTAYLNVLDLLSVRLQLVDYRARHNAVRSAVIARPVFILGLPRTGTTILYELMAQDERFRTPASWEVARPLPPPRAQNYFNDPRIARVDRAFNLLEQLAPGFRAIHAIGARLPQECVYLQAASFASEQFAYLYHVPDYRRWLLDADMTDAYRWHAHFLQHLQVHVARERWLLKAPAHLGWLRELLAQYPDATIIWTHRRPLTAIASFASLTHTLRGGLGTATDPQATGAGEFTHHAELIRRGMAQRAALDRGQFIDVSFTAICHDPLAAVAGIYRQLDMSLPPSTLAKMHAYLAAHPRHRYGEHHYTTAAYGLDAAGETALYGDYLATYAPFLGRE